MDIEAVLIYKNKTTDSCGFDAEEEQRYCIYANMQSVKRTEFYSAMQAGLKPSISIITRIEEFEQTKHIVNKKPIYAQAVEIDGAEYKIIRTYCKDTGTIELTLGSD